MSFFIFFFGGAFCHQATFVKTVLFSTAGYYNENNKIVSDWEFFATAIIKYQCSYRHIACLLTHFALGGISSNPVSRELWKSEKKKVLTEHFSLMMYDELHSIFGEITHYRNSRLIQTIKKIQQSFLYRKIKRMDR
ncbi:MAG: hypothetical protein LBV47_03895 [Bacteroidales bacterium]|nr:hypothetical protein [Bacteroidales bacterium]